MRSLGDPSHVAHTEHAVRQRGRQCHGLCPVRLSHSPPKSDDAPLIPEPNTSHPFHLFSSRSTLTGLPLAHGGTGTPAAKLHRVVSETSPQARAWVVANVQALCRSRAPLSRETATSSTSILSIFHVRRCRPLRNKRNLMPLSLESYQLV